MSELIELQVQRTELFYFGLPHYCTPRHGMTDRMSILTGLVLLTLIDRYSHFHRISYSYRIHTGVGVLNRSVGLFRFQLTHNKCKLLHILQIEGTGVNDWSLWKPIFI